MKAKTTTIKNIDKFNSIKIKNCCASKDILKKVKGYPSECEKISASHISDKDQVSRTYKELPQFNNKKTINPLQNW